MSLANILEGESGRGDLAIAIAIEGIPYVFTTRNVDYDELQSMSFWDVDGEAEPLALIQSVRQSAPELDLDRRRMIDATLSFSLVDDGDGVLESLFAIRARSIQQNIGALKSTGHTTIGVEDSSALTVGDVLYVGLETFRVTDIPTADTFISTRGRFGSRVARHYGDWLYRAPPSWLGRKAWLYMLPINQAGKIEESTAGLLWTFRVDDTPSRDAEGTWQVQCGGMLEDISSRSCCLGKEKTAPLGNPLVKYDATLGLSFVEVEDPGAFVESTGWTSRILMRGRSIRQGSSGINEKGAHAAGAIVDIDGNKIYFVSTPGVIDADGIEEEDEGYTFALEEASNFHLVSGSSAGPLLFAIHSEFGNGARDSTYDVIDGKQQASIDDRYIRSGFALDGEDVDQDSFLSLSCPQYCLVLNESRTLGDLLDEFCLIADAWWGQDRQGRLTIQPLEADRITATKVISDNDILGSPSPSSVVDERSVHPVVRFGVNESPLGEEERELVFADADLLRRYPRSENPAGRSLSIVRVDLASSGTAQRWTATPAYSLSDIEAMARRLQLSDGPGRLIVRLRCGMSALLLTAGQMVRVQSELVSLLPDYEGGKIESNRVARVLSAQPDYDGGYVDLSVQILEPLLHFASSAVIASAANEVLTLRTNGPEVRSNPGRDFAAIVGAGAACFLVDVSSLPGTPLVQEVGIVSVTDTTITLTDLPSFTVQNNVDYVVLSPVNVTGHDAGAMTDSGYRVDEMTFPEPSRIAGAIAGRPQRWR